VAPVPYYPSFFFSDLHPAAHAQVHLTKPFQFTKFTLCVWVKTKPEGVQKAFSYSTKDSYNELVLSVGSDVKLWVGGTEVDFNIHHTSEDWVHYCVRWESSTGKTDLFVSGLQGKEKILKQGYTVKPGGVAILAKDITDLMGIYNNSFRGRLSHLHLWSSSLSAEEIMSISKCQTSNIKGDIISWGQTTMQVSGGVLLEPDNSC
ncbi:C-reactive protein-like, partial [Gastrophryne carolinensis]